MSAGQGGKIGTIGAYGFRNQPHTLTAAWHVAARQFYLMHPQRSELIVELMPSFQV